MTRGLIRLLLTGIGLLACCLGAVMPLLNALLPIRPLFTCCLQA
jgi:hypothetical protein